MLWFKDIGVLLMLALLLAFNGDGELLIIGISLSVVTVLSIDVSRLILFAAI